MTGVSGKHKPSSRHTLQEVLSTLQDMVRNELAEAPVSRPRRSADKAAVLASLKGLLQDTPASPTPTPADRPATPRPRQPRTLTLADATPAAPARGTQAAFPFASEAAPEATREPDTAPTPAPDSVADGPRDRETAPAGPPEAAPEETLRLDLAALAASLDVTLGGPEPPAEASEATVTPPPGAPESEATSTGGDPPDREPPEMLELATADLLALDDGFDTEASEASAGVGTGADEPPPTLEVIELATPADGAGPADPEIEAAGNALDLDLAGADGAADAERPATLELIDFETPPAPTEPVIEATATLDLDLPLADPVHETSTAFELLDFEAPAPARMEPVIDAGATRELDLGDADGTPVPAGPETLELVAPEAPGDSDEAGGPVTPEVTPPGPGRRQRPDRDARPEQAAATPPRPAGKPKTRTGKRTATPVLTLETETPTLEGVPIDPVEAARGPAPGNNALLEDEIPVLDTIASPLPAGTGPALVIEDRFEGFGGSAASPPLPRPERARQLAIQVIARLNIELRRSGGRPLDPLIVDRVAYLLREALEQEAQTGDNTGPARNEK